MATTTEPETIVIEDIKAIKRLSIPIPEKGGLLVLKGGNGVGKTTALETVQALTTGKGKGLTKRDGTLGGNASGLGVTLTVNQMTRLRGELEVTSIEGKLSIAELVDPGLVSADAADAKRIKALVTLAGVAAEPKLFWPLFGSQQTYEAIVREGDCDDFVKLSDWIKRDCDKAARDEEEKANHAAAHAKANKEAADKVDMSGEANAAKLRDMVECAIRHEQKLTTQKEAADEAGPKAAKARHSMEKAIESYEGPTPEQAAAASKEAEEAFNAAAAANRKATESAKDAKRQFELAKCGYESARATQKTAESHEQTCQAWREQIEQAEAIMPPAEADLADAAKAVATAREANNAGVLIRNAQASLVEAEKHATAAQEHAIRAGQLRDAGKGVNEVLSGIVGQLGTPLKVRDGRLYLPTGRGDTYYAELSEGERWKIAIDIAIDVATRCVAVSGERAIVIVKQEAYQSLDWPTRKLVAEHIEGRGILFLTAEATEGELRAEEFTAK